MVVRNRNRVVIQAVLIVLVLASCTQSSPFSSYVGVNLISASAFAFSSGGWVLDDATGTYMGMAATGYDPPVADAEVYRLEIKNLLPDGDFSQTAAGSAPSGWTSVENTADSVDSVCEVVDSSLSLLGGHVLHVKIELLTDYFKLPLRDASYGITDGFLQYATYVPRFKYLAAYNGFVVEYNADTTPLITHTWKVGAGADGGDAGSGEDFLSLNTYPTAALTATTEYMITVDAETNPIFIFGSMGSDHQQQEAYVDDLRFVRTDKTWYTRLTVPAHGANTQDLIAGCYRFSVYVKRDPTVGTSEGYNRFHAAGVKLSIKRTGTATASAVLAFADPDKDDDSGTQLWQDWTLLSVDLENVNQQGDLASTTMELAITPTDDTLDTSVDCGSILISRPWLELYPDGF